MEKIQKILIVDDELNMRFLLKEALEEFEDKGVELLEAENGSDAIEFIRTEKPELVILDVIMPGISGFEVCNTVKNVLGLKAICILLLSIRVLLDDRRRGNSVGADYYIKKPFHPDELLNIVSKALGIEL